MRLPFAAESSGSKELLTFYAQLLRAQQKIYESFRSRKDWLPSGDLANDLIVVQSSMIWLLETVTRHGPKSLAEEAQVLLDAEPNKQIALADRAVDTRAHALGVLGEVDAQVVPVQASAPGVARTELVPEATSGPRHLQLPDHLVPVVLGEDDVEVVVDVALAEQDLAALRRPSLALSGEQRQLIVGQPRECPVAIGGLRVPRGRRALDVRAHRLAADPAGRCG